MNDLVFTTAQELARNIRQRRASATEVLDAHLQQIARHNQALNAVVTLDEERARARAREADAALARGDLWGALHGVPVTIKDSIETAGLRTTSGFPPSSTCRPPMPRWWRAYGQPAQSSWGRPICGTVKLAIDGA